MIEDLSVKDVMDKFNISRATVYRMIDEGLPHRNVGARKKVFDEGEVREFVEKRRADLAKSLEVGQDYSNNDIVEIFKCGNMGGMRRSHSKNALVLISFNDGNTHLYGDYWRDNILYYTGQGTSGDQDFEFAQNKTLFESETNGVTVYLFEMFTSQKYQYRGIVKLADKPFMSTETDINGATRRVCKFPLKLVNENSFLSEEFVKKEEQTKQKLAEDYIKTGKDFIEMHLSQPISEITVVSKHTTYNAVIGAYVKLRAGGKCEFCGNPAPFEYEGEPYLEFTHIIPYCEGGQDSVDNLAALCPNCATRLMKLKSDDDKRILQQKVKESEAEMHRKLHAE